MLSLDLSARHVRERIVEYNYHITNHQESIILPEEPPVIKNPFIQLQDIFNDALPSVDSDKFYSVSLLGSQGKGKTFTATVLATLAEQANFLVIYGKAEDFLEDKEGWIDQIKIKIKEHGNIWVCFVLDDMSYSTSMVSSKKSAGFKHFIADIRHVLEPVLGDIKIFMIYISHRLHSLPPMLRNSGTWIFASMLPEDRTDAIKLIPKSKEERERLDSIFQFLQKISNEGPKKDVVNYILDDRRYEFRWGKQENPGDGRLMMVSHAGEMKVLQSKGIPNMIDLESTRIRRIVLDNVSEPEEKVEEPIIEEPKVEFLKPQEEFIDPFAKLAEEIRKEKENAVL